MEYNNRMEEVVLELDGIKFTLYLLGDAFSKGNCKWDNETIRGTIQAIAMHIDRISKELDDLQVLIQ